MTLIASAGRGLAYLALALIGLPLMISGTGQAQTTGLVGVVTGLGLLVLHLFGFALFSAPQTDAKRGSRNRHTPARTRANGDVTWSRITQARVDRLAEIRREGKSYRSR